MSDIAIKVEELSKLYKIGTSTKGSLSETLTNLFSNSKTSEKEIDFWALKDISFEVKKGEVVGVIGRNGAGKSTLFKILSRITEPTTGKIEINGRVSSLLEVGTGFHPELTGRENIFLNGTILGMKRTEIKSKFDEIVAFSGIEKFIDTPVKRYSSGMYVRLAFAVAAHLEPEILIIDEVLAVGDGEFQKKCLGKMEDVSRKDGRTILFVSHDMGAISKLCQKAQLLDKGRLIAMSNVSEIVDLYLNKNASVKSGEITWPNSIAPGDETSKLISIKIFQNGRIISGHIDITKEFIIEVNYETYINFNDFAIGMLILNAKGDIVLHSSDSFGVNAQSTPFRQIGSWKSKCKIKPFSLNIGSYYLLIVGDVPNQRLIFSSENDISFTVENTSPKMSKYPANQWKGVMGPEFADWEIIDI